MFSQLAIAAIKLTALPLRSRFGHSTQGHSHRAVAARQLEDAYDDYDEYDQVAEEGDDCPEHHLGLLRVHCSIAINSE